MAVSLTIQEGKEVGRQFQFDQPEVSIGRTAENDVVLMDPGVSRKHAILSLEGGKVLVRDAGSANGTQVNGTPVTGEGELQTGDTLTVGPVVFAVEVQAGEDGSTRILDVSALAPPPAKKPAGKPAENNAIQRKATTALPAKAIPPGKIQPTKAKTAAPPVSASERARMQRQATGLMGKVNLFLLDKPPAVKYALFGGVGLLGLGLLIGVVKLAMGGRGPNVMAMADASKQQFPLPEGRNDQIYGYGDQFNVTTQTKDELHLTFEYSDAIPRVVYLRFSSQGIDSREEVQITLNETPVGAVEAGFGDYVKEQKLKLPKKSLKTGMNEVVFDNTKNPPGSDTWAIVKPRLVMLPLPQGSASELTREAKKQYEFATQKFQEKDLDAKNRYLASKALERALLDLEAVEPKPDLYNLVVQSKRDVDRDLEAKCSQIKLTAKRNEELHLFDKALRNYKDGLLYFPSDDHPCNAQLNDKIQEYGEQPPAEGEPAPPPQ